MVGRHTKLSDADRQRLSRLIKDGETRTAAELVLVTAEACGRYGVFAFLWPALAALVAGGVAALLFPGLAATRLFLLEAAVFVVLAGLLQWPRVLLRAVPRTVRGAHAHPLSSNQFAIRVEGRTPRRTGVLLFLALAEREVFILPDSGVSAIVDAGAWRAVIDRLAAATRGGPPAEALAAAITEILAVLERQGFR